jgi:hypothetical protein
LCKSKRLNHRHAWPADRGTGDHKSAQITSCLAMTMHKVHLYFGTNGLADFRGWLKAHIIAAGGLIKMKLYLV